MANAILPEEYLVPPVVSQDELEDLIVQANPDIEDRPYWHLRASAAQLRTAVEKLLLGYRQSIFMTENGASMLPAQLWLLAETISANYRQAWIYAEAACTVTPAFELFLANMDIEMVAP
jgi:hypothetical protein